MQWWKGPCFEPVTTFRITAQLIDARADKHLWAKKFERNSRDVLALQDELASPSHVRSMFN